MKLISNLKNKFQKHPLDAWVAPKDGFLPDDLREVQVIIQSEDKNKLITSFFDPEKGWGISEGKVLVWKEIDPTIKKLIG